ncbi:hypothetical protein [Deminuibacter soli]|uniref:Uncharacterized protein n=1 Tax=Deminuibacter soli TaxID=2291815 RepID=A0A3E1NPJ0_9BACT|nr:hypothetical protein [Deminuibacter soli]RFM29744.1 hypothetical protein DXN05_01835 [Deminuibacter soli]
MDIKNMPIHELAKSVKASTDKAVRKLIEENAAKGIDMVVGDLEGNYGKVPATELLKRLKEKEK